MKDKSDVTERWNALLRFDDEIRDAAAKLLPFGEEWVSELGWAYFALNEDRKYLPRIVERLHEDAMRQRTAEWLTAFRHTADGERCTEESLAVLMKAQALGYSIKVESDGAFAMHKVGRGTTYLRSNDDIERFHRFL